MRPSSDRTNESAFTKNGQILVVDHECEPHTALCNMLKTTYSVLQAENGKDALQLLKQYGNLILLVVTALHMPCGDGGELLNYMQNDPELSHIPVILFVDEKEQQEALCYLDKGASDLSLRTVCPELMLHRIQNTLRLRIDSLISDVEHFNKLTGLAGKDIFGRIAYRLMAEHPGLSYLMVAIDIEHFKLFNSWYGFETGNMLLAEIGHYLKTVQQTYEGLASYMGEDNFAILLPDDPTALQTIYSGLTRLFESYDDRGGFRPIIGVSTLTGVTGSIERSYDRALIGMEAVRLNYSLQFGYYTDQLKDSLEKQQLLNADVRKGLERNEFFFVLQPKCNMRTGRIVGAEALVRWCHPKKGLISPAEFIPELERSGLITRMDLYLWEEVCKTLRSWQDSGLKPVPVSINVSRIDIYTENVADRLRCMTEKYHIDPKLLPIEITEGVFADDQRQLPLLVNELHQNGFTVVMDDFGKGYSSLNMLKNINIDELKLDMEFLFHTDNNIQKGASILESVIRLGNMLNLPMIAEGVETREQMAFLLRMQCTFGQGYYFYKPMPVTEFEHLLSDPEQIDTDGIRLRSIGSLQLQEMLDEHLINDAALNNLLGPIAFYDATEHNLSLYRANQAYCQLIGYHQLQLEGLKSRLIDNIHEEDRAALQKAFQKAYSSPMQPSKLTLRHRRGDGKWHWISMRIFFFHEQNQHYYFYASLQDITSEKLQEESADQLMNALYNITPGTENSSVRKMNEANLYAGASILAKLNKSGMIGGYCEDGFPLYFVNNAMLDLLGYTDYDEFAEAIHCSVEHTIYEEDLERITGEIGSDYYPGKEYTVTYRMVKKDGSLFWVLDKGEVIIAEDGRLAIISACTDITESMEAHQRLQKSNETLIQLNNELSFFNNYLPGGYHRCKAADGYPFLYVSNRFLQMFGYSREEIKLLFDDKYLNMVHPEDRRQLIVTTERLKGNDTPTNQEYRMLSKNGYIWVIDQTRYLEYEGQGFYQGLVMNISNQVKMRQKMELLTEHCPASIALLTVKDGKKHFEILTGGLYHSCGYTSIAIEHMLNHGIYQNIFHPNDIERITTIFSSSLEKHEPFRCMYRIRESNGNWRWLDTRGHIVTDTDEQLQMLYISTDATESRSYAEKLLLRDKQLKYLLPLTKVTCFEWDFQTDRLELFGQNLSALRTDRKNCGDGSFSQVIDGVSAYLFHNTLIPPECYYQLEQYKKIIQHAPAGQPLSLKLPLRAADQKKASLYISCETIADLSGKSTRAIGYLTVNNINE